QPQVFSFDPWGRRRNPFSWTFSDIPTSFLINRGFNGHEHLDRLELINMNGRLYDPLVGRFLSPDNFVQSPENSQSFNRYSYCLNNPLIYTDPDGEFFWHLVIGAAIGGNINWLANGAEWNAEGLAYFGVGALAGALGTGVGAGISSAIAGGSFGAGFVGSSAAMTATSSFATGVAIGGAGGFSSGFVLGTGNGLMQGQSFGNALGSGIEAGGWGALSGGIIGGIAGGIDARMDNRHFITGKPPYKDVSLDVPFVGQDPGSMDCLLANSEMLEKYYGGNRTIEDFREIYNALPEGATVSDYYSKAGFKVMGEPRKGIHIARTMEMNKFPTTIVHNEGTYNGTVLDHNSTITRIRMWTPKSNATFWVNDPVRGANYRWSQRALEKVLIEMLTIGGIQ
ncbi:hypothetical protein JXI42_07330, partial [bacterium]|nr:hypothetical protein [bacterium]